MTTGTGPGDALAPGTLVAGRYRVHERIGAGGMGVVHRATDTRLKRQVALKRVLLRGIDDDEAADVRRRTLREAEIAARVHHSRIVTLFDVLDHAGGPVLVLEYLPSRSLGALLTDAGVLTPGVAARVGAQIAEALAAAHAAGIVHRDVKPDNVLVGPGDPLGPVKLTDFGISHLPDSQTLTPSGMGTPPYFAPEVALGGTPDPAADVYALGASLRVATEGVPPFGWTDGNPLDLIRRIGRDPVPLPSTGGPLGALLTRMTAATPDDRPSAAEAAALLWEFADRHEPLPPAPAPAPRQANGPGPDTPTAPPPVPRRRGPLLLAVTAALLALAALAAVLVAVTGPGTDPGTDPGDAPPVLARPDGFPAAIGPIAVGDARTVDVCSLVRPDALARFGPITPQPDYGGFDACALQIPQPAGDTAEVATEFRAPSEIPDGPQQQLGDVTLVRTTTSEENCVRYLYLADRTPIRIAAAYYGSTPPATDLCDAAETAAASAAATLAERGIGRRAPTTTGLWTVDACSLLTDADLTVLPAQGRAAPFRGFGGWTCDWGLEQDDTTQVVVSFDRSNPPSQAGDPVPGTPAFVRTGGDEVCNGEIPKRTYRGVLGDELAEVLRVRVFDPGRPRQETCARAAELVLAADARLR